MMFGLTYAQFVATIGLSMLGLPGSDVSVNENQFRYQFTLGANAQNKSGPGQDGFVTITALSNQKLPLNLFPMYAVGASVDGAVFVNASIAKNFDVAGLTITPHFGPVLYQSDVGNGFSSKELIQFRTGFQVSREINDQLSFVAGFYHISNASLTSKSAGIDVTHFGVIWRF